MFNKHDGLFRTSLVDIQPDRGYGAWVAIATAVSIALLPIALYCMFFEQIALLLHIK